MQIEPFSTLEARIVVEQELGAPIEELFSEFSAEPIAAASLAQVCAVISSPIVPCSIMQPDGTRASTLTRADQPTPFLCRCMQVYRARVRATGQEVAVKVQRPAALATISKDMYVMRRAVGVYERIVRRFTAQVRLCGSCGTGFSDRGQCERGSSRHNASCKQCWRQAVEARC